MAITLNNLAVNQQNQGNMVAAERTMREALVQLQHELGELDAARDRFAAAPSVGRVTWDGRTDEGMRAPSGLYFLQARSATVIPWRWSDALALTQGAAHPDDGERRALISALPINSINDPVQAMARTA